MFKVPDYSDWTPANADVFWSSIARHDHVVQLYQDDEVFYHTLTGFVLSTIQSNENAVVIATESHLNALEARMERNGFNIDKLISDGGFIPLDVDEIIAEFMVEGEADESRLMETLSSLSRKASHNKKAFRMCGEIAPTLLAQGHREVATKVEHQSEIFNNENPTCIYCAYSKTLFHGDETGLMQVICDAHSKRISGSERHLTQVYYR
jgi:MEDS: MEthanogen/methylotroph, DcmR Sensory domain